MRFSWYKTFILLCLRYFKMRDSFKVSYALQTEVLSKILFEMQNKKSTKCSKLVNSESKAEIIYVARSLSR